LAQLDDEVSDCLRDFDALSPSGWLVLHSAALLGEPFEPEPLEQVAQLSRNDVVVALDELIRNDLVRWESDGRALRFRNALLRVLAEQSAGPDWRLGARLRVAEALPVNRFPPRRPAPLTEGSANRASVQDLATTTTGPRTVDPWPDMVPETVRWKDRLEQALVAGESLAMSGRLTESLDWFANLNEEVSGRPTTRARIAWWRVWTWRLLGRHREAHRELRAALTGLTAREEKLRARLRRAQLTVALESGEVTSQQMVDEAAEAVRADSDPTSRIHTLALLAAADVRLHRVEQAEYRVHQAVPWLGEMSGMPVEQVDALGWLGAAATGIAQPEIALWCYRKGLRLTERHGITSAIPRFAVELGELEVMAGELADATWHWSLARRVTSYLRSDYLLDAVTRLQKMIMQAVLGATGERPTEQGSRLTSLSRRELDIAMLVGDGRTNKQIARSLSLSHKTVETYLARIFKKLGATSRSQVAAEIGRARGDARTLSG